MRLPETTQEANAVRPDPDSRRRPCGEAWLGTAWKQRMRPGPGTGLRSARMKLTEYTEAIASGWTKGELTRAILHDLPRRAARMGYADRERMLNERPVLTATGWDALLAAMVEHVAQLHGHAVPQWVEERERFLDMP